MDLTPEDNVRLTSFVTKMIGHQRTMATGLVEVAKGMEMMATGYEALQLDVAQIRAEAYRAGREDAAEAVWVKATELRGKPFRTGQVGIEYVNGMEDASEVARGGAEAAVLEGVER